MPVAANHSFNLSFTVRSGTTRATGSIVRELFPARSGNGQTHAFPSDVRGVAGPSLQSVPQRGEHEIPARQRRRPLLLFDRTCAGDGLAHAAALALTTGGGLADAGTLAAYLAKDDKSEWAARARLSLKFCEMQMHLSAS